MCRIPRAANYAAMSSQRPKQPNLLYCQTPCWRVEDAATPSLLHRQLKSCPGSCRRVGVRFSTTPRLSLQLHHQLDRPTHLPELLLLNRTEPSHQPLLGDGQHLFALDEGGLCEAITPAGLQGHMARLNSLFFPDVLLQSVVDSTLPPFPLGLEGGESTYLYTQERNDGWTTSAD